MTDLVTAALLHRADEQCERVAQERWQHWERDSWDVTHDVRPVHFVRTRCLECGATTLFGRSYCPRHHKFVRKHGVSEEPLHPAATLRYLRRRERERCE